MKINERINALNNAGINTNNYFSLLVNKPIPAGTVINISFDTGDVVNDVPVTQTAFESTVANQIAEDGYVRNSKLHRRWIAAQYMRMLQSPIGWTEYMKRNYSYMYQLEMMMEEVRVISKIEFKDAETFKERSCFFSLARVCDILTAYEMDVRKYIEELKENPVNYRGEKCISGRGVPFTRFSDIDTVILRPISETIYLCKNCTNYSDMYLRLKTLKRFLVILPYEYTKMKDWVNVFQLEGAYYTLRNIIMFHEVRLYYNDCFYNMEDSLRIIRNLSESYAGYQMNGLLKKTIEKNNFNFVKSIMEHKE